MVDVEVHSIHNSTEERVKGVWGHSGKLDGVEVHGIYKSTKSWVCGGVHSIHNSTRERVKGVWTHRERLGGVKVHGIRKLIGVIKLGSIEGERLQGVGVRDGIHNSMRLMAYNHGAHKLKNGRCDSGPKQNKGVHVSCLG